MTTKRAGWAFLWMTVSFLAASLFAGYFFPYAGIAMTALLSELCLLIPAAFFLAKGRAGLASQLGLRLIKPTTFLMVIVYHICCYPIIIAMNAFTLLFSDNAALDIQAEFTGESYFAIWFFVGLAGPLVEEFVFRGVLLGGLRTTGRILSAIILSAALFGMVHMNINQLSYTFFAGIYLGLLAEATGSLIPSMVCHVLMNSFSVAAMYFYDNSLLELDGIMEQTEQATASYLITGCVFLVISVFTTVLAMLMLKVISLNEGNIGCVENIFRKKTRAERYGSLFSIPLVAGMVLSAVVIIWLMVIGT